MSHWIMVIYSESWESQERDKENTHFWYREQCIHWWGGGYKARFVYIHSHCPLVVWGQCIPCRTTHVAVFLWSDLPKWSCRSVISPTLGYQFDMWPLSIYWSLAMVKAVCIMIGTQSIWSVTIVWELSLTSFPHALNLHNSYVLAVKMYWINWLEKAECV